jgi:leucyl aminopeptidase (aminopeptidase T)
MAFDLETFFGDIFKPAQGEVVTIMYDLPHGDIADSDAWQERRQMAEDWRTKLAGLADEWGIIVNPTVTYAATGSNNADLPGTCKMGDREVTMDEVITGSTILIAMPQFSATAPLYPRAKTSDRLRVGSMPGVAKFMEESGLSADYNKIGEKCKKLEVIFNRAVAAEVEFSTGHTCFFDLPAENKALVDDGILHPERAGSNDALSNLPAGEVFCVPNENEDSKTRGELPQKIGDQVIAYVVENNRIADVKGSGAEVEELRKRFATDRGWQNIAEFAIGVNDKARVTGIVLEDEKAGFHWAYGRSDHFGGQCGVDKFNSPEDVVHQDVVYAKESPITCKKLDVIFPDGARQTLIVDGELQV